MPTFNQDIREIRQTVYGRDMREPLADAILKLDAMVENEPAIITYSRIAKVEPVLLEDIIDWTEIIEHVIPILATDYQTYNAGSNRLRADPISDDNYSLIDNAGYDTTELISGNDYLFIMDESYWSNTGLNPSSYIEYEEVPHRETYELVINP